MRRAILLLPLVIFLVVAGFLARGLWLDPTELPSALIGKPLPEFALKSVDEPERALTRADLIGKPVMINVWATWCPTCRDEHAMLNKLAEQGVRIYGINYKDDVEAARRWLAEYGNPYQIDVADPEGSLGLDLGVYGAPETFLIDRHGVIRYKHVGEVNERVWRDTLAAQWAQLQEDQ